MLVQSRNNIIMKNYTYFNTFVESISGLCLLGRTYSRPYRITLLNIPTTSMITCRMVRLLRLRVIKLLYCSVARHSKLWWIEAYSQELWSCQTDGSQATMVSALRNMTSDNPVFGLAITSSGRAIVSAWRPARIFSVMDDGSRLRESRLSQLGSDAIFSLSYSDPSIDPTGKLNGMVDCG